MASTPASVPHPEPPHASPASSSARAQLASLLSLPLRVTTTDGRVFTGTLLSIDRVGSLLLSEAVETRAAWPLAPLPADVSAADASDAARQANVARFYPRSETFDGRPPRPPGQREMAAILVPASSIVGVVIEDDTWAARAGVRIEGGVAVA